MCHSTESRPPAPPNTGEVAASGSLILDSADGTKFQAFHATPVAGTGNVILLPDVRGVHPYYEHLAIRFAEAGFHTTAIDYYGRTAGPGDRGADFDWQPHFDQVDPANVEQDVAAAAAHLTAANPGPTFTVGFCFGGSQSWRLAASTVDLAGVVGFYGQPGLVRDALPRFDKPMLLLIAGADVATPQSEFADFTTALTEAGKDHEAHVYDGAPHSFFDRAFGDWAPACDDAWTRILAFTAKHGATA